jgi:hypothetical protein
MRAAAEREAELPPEEGVELADGGGIHEGVAADAQEVGSKLAADVLEGLADHIRARAAVDDDMIPGRFDPVDLPVIDEKDALAVPDGNAPYAQLFGECLECREASFDIGRDGVETLAEKGNDSGHVVLLSRTLSGSPYCAPRFVVCLLVFGSVGAATLRPESLAGSFYDEWTRNEFGDRPFERLRYASPARKSAVIGGRSSRLTTRLPSGNARSSQIAFAPSAAAPWFSRFEAKIQTKGESQMEDKKPETQPRVLARVLADELDHVEGGMRAQYTYLGTNDQWQQDDGSFGLDDTDQL